MDTSRFFRPTPPPHVPASLVLDFDVFNPGAEDERVYEDYTGLHVRGAPDIAWTRHNGGHWLVTRGEYFREINNDFGSFSNTRGLETIQRGEGVGPLIPIEIDPPAHGEYRALIAPAFSPRGVEALAGGIRDLAIELIENFRAARQCEFVADFAQRLPIHVFLRLAGIPDRDRLELLDAVARLLNRDTADPEDPRRRIARYLAPLFAARKVEPGEDLLSRLTQARLHGRPLSDAELLGIGTLLVIGGLDSVASTMGLVTHCLARSPALRRRLIDDPAILPNAVEEFLRRFPTTSHGPSRILTRDLQFHGVEMRTGDRISLPRPFANLDYRLHPDPLAVNFDRPDLQHASFGHGPHRCIGSTLARLELQIFLREWLARIPDFGVAPGAAVKYDTAAHISVAALPLVW